MNEKMRKEIILWIDDTLDEYVRISLDRLKAMAIRKYGVDPYGIDHLIKPFLKCGEWIVDTQSGVAELVRAKDAQKTMQEIAEKEASRILGGNMT